jgi:ubiquinone/menaquinone biosynthesis C-methylase UbiE
MRKPDPGQPAALDAARAYDAWFDRAWGSYAFQIEQRALLQSLESVDGRMVLDAGCGTARFSDVLIRNGARVVGLDVDNAMLSIAAERTNARLILGDALSLPFRDRAFDVAVAVTVCEFVGQPGRVVAELARVVRPGGRLAVGALNRSSPWGLAHARRFRRPPWQGARFLTLQELRTVGAALGRARITSALYLPGALPGRTRIGPVVESLGRLVPRLGAFRVLVVDLPSD